MAMTLQVDRPSGINVGINNPGTIVYVKGNDTTDGSIRFFIRPNGKSKLETRKNGVWNASGLELGEDSLLLGPNVSLSAQGNSLVLTSINDKVSSIVLDIPISDLGTEEPRVLRADQRVNRFVSQSVLDTDILASQFLLPRTTVFQGYVFSIYLKVGSTAASEDVNLTVTTGLTPGGDLLYDRAYGADIFPANTEVQLIDTIDLGKFIGDEILLTITTATPFSLLGDSSSLPWFAADFQVYKYEEIISFNTGTDKFLVDIFGAVMSDVNGNIMSSASPISSNG